ncbi:MAG: hypothetical protein Q4C52_05240 [Eubacteriales bacterium]|nr:hypothetical protein [Eubacteriales bacterium]
MTEEKQEAEDMSEDKGFDFPYDLEDGKLEVNSLFQFTGTNPDYGDEEGEDIASLEVINKSDQHLASAEIKVSLGAGTELTFEITDVPAGQSVMVFEKNNTSYDTSDKCIAVEDTAEFEETTALMEDKLIVDVQETTVTLTNTTGEDLINLLLHCHCLVDDTYFGGLVYSYPIEMIPAGQSVTVQADECYMGTASVVRVSQDNGEE